MQGILDGFKNIFDLLIMLKDFIVNLVKSSIELIKVIGTTAGNVTNLILTLPPWLMAIASLTLGVSVLYLIIGRQSGK